MLLLLLLLLLGKGLVWGKWGWGRPAPTLPSTSMTADLLTLCHLTTMSIPIAGDADERH